MKQKIKKIFKEILAIVQTPEMQVLPGQLAFFFVLSVIPIFAILVIITSKLSLSSASFLNYLSNAMPSGILESIIGLLDYNNIDTNIIVFLITTFVLASNGAFSIINVSNTIYKTKYAPWLNRRIKAILLTFSIVFLLLFMILIPTFGTKIIGLLNKITFMKDITDNISPIFNIISIPLSIFIIYFNLKIIYVISPDKKIKSSSCTKGALFTTIGWIISSRIYSYYVTHFSKYDLVYGSLTNIIILMLWFYILSYIFVIGMSMNVLNEKNE